MNLKVNTIADQLNGKCRPEGERPLRIALRDALSSAGIVKNPQGQGALALVHMTLREGAQLEVSEPESEGVDINFMHSESASIFLIAIQTAQVSDSLRGRPSEVDYRGYSANLLPLHELITRVCVALKRNHAVEEKKLLFSVGDLHLDASRRLVKKRGRPLHLTPKEFALLHRLMTNAGKPVSHMKLLRSVWGPEYGYEREYLRSFVRQLRLKIEDNPANPKYLLTEPGIGYRIAESLE